MCFLHNQPLFDTPTPVNLGWAGKCNQLKLTFNSVNISLCLEVVEAEFEPGSQPPAFPDSNRTSCLS